MYQWGIIGAGIMSFDAEKRKSLKSQDWLQTLVECEDEKYSGRILGSMIDFIPVEYQDNSHSALKEALLQPNIKIVSMTVTEGGYFLNPNTSKFDPHNPQVVHDSQHPDSPRTIFGILVQALYKRHQAGIPPFTILSCDNIPKNGHVVQSVVVGLAKLMMGSEFVSWVETNVKFPNSMVDRITPATSDLERQWIQEKFDYQDDWPVFCEPFRQWVMEDSFVNNERPPFEKVGVTFAKDVVPYEFMKLRVLNGGHAALCYPSALLGLNYVHQAMEHEAISKFLDVLERTEIIPTLGPVPNTSLPEYWELIASRFANSCMNDTLSRICFDGANRQPKFIIPVITDQLKRYDQYRNDTEQANNTGVDGLAIVSALWCRYCQGTDEAGETIAPNDPIWDRLHETACKAKETKDPSCWLAMEEIYGTVGDHPQFVESFSKAWHMIQNKGVEATLQNYIDSSSQ